jgi:hypothetical protein
MTNPVLCGPGNQPPGAAAVHPTHAPSPHPLVNDTGGMYHRIEGRGGQVGEGLQITEIQVDLVSLGLTIETGTHDLMFGLLQIAI